MLQKLLSHQHSITITPYDISKAMKTTKCGKPSGVNGISAEQFVFANCHIHAILSLLFSAIFFKVICHACMFTKIVIIAK